MKAGIEKGIEKGMEKGMEKGQATAQHEIALKMISEKMDPELISKLTGLSLETVRHLLVH